jgi:hypothetical protein
MLVFAQQQAPDTAGLTFTQGDMTALDIPALQQQPADMAVVLLGTFSHLLENQQALACMQSVGKHLKQGGLLVLELAHPGELRCCWLLLLTTGACLLGSPGRAAVVYVVQCCVVPQHDRNYCSSKGRGNATAHALSLPAAQHLAAACAEACVSTHHADGEAAGAGAAGDLFDGSLIVNSAGGEMWEVERRGRKLLVEWGSELDDFDPVTQVRSTCMCGAMVCASRGTCMCGAMVCASADAAQLLGIYCPAHPALSGAPSPVRRMRCRYLLH